MADFCDPMYCSTPGLPIHQQLPEFTQTHVHWVNDAIQPSHPLSSPSLPTFNLSQHQAFFKWVRSSHQVTKASGNSSTYLCVCLVTQSCLTLCDPMDYSPPGSSLHGLLQARILEKVAMPSTRGSFQPRDCTQIPCVTGRFFTTWATTEA